MVIDWKPEYSVRVEEIDSQHKMLVGMIDRLYNAIYNNKTHEELKPIFGELVSYSELHFSTEEKYFEKFNYEFSTEHKEEHRMFEEKIIGMFNKFKNNEVEISFELIDFLENWLITHMADQDQKYVRCFKDHGL